MTNAVSTKPAANGKQAPTLKDHLNSPAMLQEIARVVPSHMKPERMVRVALTAIMRTPDLAKCDQASFFKALLDLSQWGLEPDGRRAHLIPFNNTKRGCKEVQLIIDYKGYVELAYRSGFVKSIHADLVRRGDSFVYDRGDVRLHTPWFLRTDADKPEEAGDIFAVYCRVELSDGAVKTEVMSLEEVNSIRARSKAKSSGPWVTDYPEMAKKTVFRRVTKWIPLSAELQTAMERDDDRLDELAHVGTFVQHTQPSGMEGLKSSLSELTHEPSPELDESFGDGPSDEELVAAGINEPRGETMFDKGAANAQEN